MNKNNDKFCVKCRNFMPNRYGNEVVSVPICTNMLCEYYLLLQAGIEETQTEDRLGKINS